jgi:formylglycine-generating enzyme required for sulfatase activity
MQEADLCVELGDGVSMCFRRIQPGSFRMGARGFYADEEPPHLVQVAQPFYLGSFPVTQEQFAVFTKDRGIAHKNGFSGEGKGRHPAEDMDWFEARSFCDWLSPKIQGRPGWKACLPSEIQWEYACRAGTDTEYCSGDGEAALREVGWFAGSSESRPQPVGTLSPNDWGLYDMHGNVWEWCSDVWDEGSYRDRPEGYSFARDASFLRDKAYRNDDDDTFRVLRGGSWNDSARICRSAYRFRLRAGFRDWIFGFRVCLLPGPVSSQPADRAEAQAGDEKRGGTTSGESQAGAEARPASAWDDASLPPLPSDTFKEE